MGVGFSGYFWLAFGFDDCYSLLVMAVTLFLIVFRWLLVLSVPIRTAPLPYKNPKKLAEFVEPKFAALLNRIKEIDLKVDWFLAMDIWQTKDYADVKQLQVQEIKQQWVDILVHLAELDGLRPHDVAQVANDEFNVCFRAGHHCCQPLMRDLKVPATTRMSFGVYNSEADVDMAIEAIKKAYLIFGL